jgi:hypothetical protein
VAAHSKEQIISYEVPLISIKRAMRGARIRSYARHSAGVARVTPAAIKTSPRLVTR